MELRQTFERASDLVIVYVMADNQVNGKTLRFIDALGLRERIHFGVDPESAAIDRLGIRLANPEAIEAGVPLPATYLLDAGGRVRFVDVREDFHIWLDSAFLRNMLESAV